VVGWEIGSVDLKAARVGPGGVLAARAALFAIQDGLDRLVDAMRSLWRQAGGDPADRHAVARSGERSPRFRSQREGVNRILDAVQRAFDPGKVRIFDSGGTTTSIVPIAAGRVVAEGHTTPDRLGCGELVFAGVLRTPVEALATDLPCAGGRAFVASEGLALTGDVWVYLERLSERLGHDEARLASASAVALLHAERP